MGEQKQPNWRENEAVKAYAMTREGALAYTLDKLITLLSMGTEGVAQYNCVEDGLALIAEVAADHEGHPLGGRIHLELMQRGWIESPAVVRDAAPAESDNGLILSLEWKTKEKWHTELQSPCATRFHAAVAMCVNQSIKDGFWMQSRAWRISIARGHDAASKPFVPYATNPRIDSQVDELCSWFNSLEDKLRVTRERGAA